MGAAVHLDPLALDFLWEALDAGDLPYPLWVRSHGATMDERAALRQGTLERLRAAGLLDAAGRIADSVDRMLGVLASHRMSVDAAFLPERGAVPVCAMAAAGRDRAVLAVQGGDGDAGVRLSEIPPDALVSAVVDLLPAQPRGVVASVSLPTSVMAGVTAGAVTAGRVGGRTEVRDEQQVLAELTAMPRLRGGQIAANSRDDLGGRRRSPVLAWFDNETGRYTSRVRPGGDGHQWITVAPADTVALRQRVGELLADVTR